MECLLYHILPHKLHFIILRPTQKKKTLNNYFTGLFLKFIAVKQKDRRHIVNVCVGFNYIFLFHYENICTINNLDFHY